MGRNNRRGPAPEKPFFGAPGEAWDDWQERYNEWERGGTSNSTNFRSVPQRNDPTVTNHYFNTPGDGGDHGHVKEQKNADGTVSYPYVRDVEGNEYNTE
jgi:hypothetical protein